MTSLRRKITISYTLIAGLIFLLSIFAYADMLFLESHIEEGEVVTLLKDNMLELRRHEKNLLLYRTAEELQQIDQYVAQATENLTSHRELYISLIGAIDFDQLLNRLNAYGRLFTTQVSDMIATGTANPEPYNSAVFEDIRKLGHQVSEVITELAADERQRLVAMAHRSQWALAGTILVMAMLTVAIGWRMSRVIGIPLKLIEQKLRYIANGRFDHLEPVTQDQEFISFTNAFNRMLHELDLRHRRLLQAEKLASLGVLMSGVAHELNNPLGNISSSCQLLLEELDQVDAVQQQEWLLQIDNETERAKHIVKALLEYGQKKAFNLEALLLKNIIEKSMLLLRNQLKSAAKVELDVADTFYIRGDMQRMQQVFINLIRNALNAGGDEAAISIKALPAGASSILDQEEVHFVGDPACVLNQQQSYCEIIIADNGPGISRQIIEKIFDPFFTTNEPGHGTGLGLYIVQEIIQEHEGCIGVRSVAGQGTQFIIRLPVALEDGDE
ncbi:MAG: HAMP domain-containing histidine kinase [Gammaproteobacteria bacterium]|nr:HAMP domain-containing histidine kinase [Gammaproteobacteria bacterium]